VGEEATSPKEGARQIQSILGEKSTYTNLMKKKNNKGFIGKRKALSQERDRDSDRGSSPQTCEGKVEEGG